MGNKTVKKIALGAAIAGAAGYVAGVLTAPSSGKKTRKELKNAAANSFTDAEKQLKKLHTELGELVGQAHDRGEAAGGKAHKKFSQALEDARASKDKVREVLSAVHEGEANDHDLQQALNNAKHAIDHLKDFLQK